MGTRERGSRKGKFMDMGKMCSMECILVWKKPFYNTIP